MHLNFRNINDAFYSLVQAFNDPELNDITETQSRNGPVLVIQEPVTLTYREPRERVLFNSARDANPFFHLYESLWMLAGRNDVAPVAYYASNMKNYSDDGRLLNGAYGYRWRYARGSQYVKRTYEDNNGTNNVFSDRHDQLDILINHLRADPNSRRAVLQMWNVEDDLLKIGQKGVRCDYCGGTGDVCWPGDRCKVCNATGMKGEIQPSKDVCCNLSVMFSIRQTDGMEHIDFGDTYTLECSYLDMTVTNRSNDLIWGCLGANYVHFSFLQEYMAARLGVEVGKYHHFSNNLHIYKDKFEPEKWLRAHDEDVTDEVTYNRLHNLYTYSKPKLIPLVQNPEVFEKELPKFVESFSGKKTTIGNWEEPFFDTVAQPMFMAFAEYKLGLLASALQFAETIEDDAWRIAAVRWLQRRKEKRDGKKEVQIQ